MKVLLGLFDGDLRCTPSTYLLDMSCCVRLDHRQILLRITLQFRRGTTLELCAPISDEQLGAVVPPHPIATAAQSGFRLTV